ncbi:type II toxin-antitoxin system HicB family antitoxin [Myxococcota bacterium]
MMSCRLPVVIFPAPDVPGEWVAHCLPIDVVSQGSSVGHAVEMIQEAVALCMLSDAQEGLDPLAVRRPAPRECWEMFDQMNTRGLVPLEELADDSQVRGVVGYLTVTRPRLEAIDQDPEALAPPPWMVVGAEPRDSQRARSC